MHSLVDLAHAAGVTPRTIRYYIAQGLLPSPTGQGPAARYTDGHLARLRLIRRLQDDHLPLAEIRERIGSLDDETVTDLLDTTPTRSQPTPGDDALNYVQRVIGERSAPLMMRAAPMPAPMRATFERRAPDEFPLPGERDWIREHASPYADPASPVLPSRGLPTTERSTWERVALTSNIELHIRRPLDRRSIKRLDQLLAFARELFGGT